MRNTLSYPRKTLIFQFCLKETAHRSKLLTWALVHTRGYDKERSSRRGSHTMNHEIYEPLSNTLNPCPFSLSRGYTGVLPEPAHMISNMVSPVQLGPSFPYFYMWIKIEYEPIQTRQKYKTLGNSHQRNEQTQNRLTQTGLTQKWEVQAK